MNRSFARCVFGLAVSMIASSAWSGEMTVMPRSDGTVGTVAPLSQGLQSYSLTAPKGDVQHNTGVFQVPPSQHNSSQTPRSTTPVFLFPLLPNGGVLSPTLPATMGAGTGAGPRPVR